MATTLQTPSDVLERRCRQVLERADAYGVDFDAALDATDWPHEEKVEVRAYHDGECS